MRFVSKIFFKTLASHHAFTIVSKPGPWIESPKKVPLRAMHFTLCSLLGSSGTGYYTHIFLLPPLSFSCLSLILFLLCRILLLLHRPCCSSFFNQLNTASSEKLSSAYHKLVYAPYSIRSWLSTLFHQSMAFH